MLRRTSSPCLLIGVVAGGSFRLGRATKPGAHARCGLLAQARPSPGSLTVAFATYFGVFSIFFLTALYLQVVVGYTAYRTATLFVPMAVAMILASTFAGRWVARVRARACRSRSAAWPRASGFCSPTSSSCAAPASSLSSFPSRWPGVGFGIAVVPITSVALSVVPARALGHGRLGHHDQPGGGDRRGGGRPGLAL